MLKADRIEMSEANGDEICESASDAKHHYNRVEWMEIYG